MDVGRSPVQEYVPLSGEEGFTQARACFGEMLEQRTGLRAAGRVSLRYSALMAR
jgi:hypothetical protein